MGRGHTFARIALPIMHIKHNLHATYENSASFALASNPAITASVENFFSGNIISPRDIGGNTDLTFGLEKARFKQNQTAQGFGDITLMLGHVIKPTAALSLEGSLSALIPAAPTVQGNYIFEPVLGSNGHGALGCWAEATYHHALSNKFTGVISLRGSADYFFQAHETRTLGLSLDNSALGLAAGKSFFAHYYGIGLVNQDAKPLTPAANLLTQDVNVRPGFTVAQGLNLTLQHDVFALHATYQCTYKQREQLQSSRNFLAQDYNYTWVIANHDYNTNVALDLAAQGIALTPAMIDLNAATNPAQLTHILNYSISITPPKSCLMGMMGGAYEWSSRNNAFDQYSLYASLGCSW